MHNLHTCERTYDLVRSVEAIGTSVTGEVSIDAAIVRSACVFVPLTVRILTNRWTYDIDLICHIISMVVDLLVLNPMSTPSRRLSE